MQLSPLQQMKLDYITAMKVLAELRTLDILKFNQILFKHKPSNTLRNDVFQEVALLEQACTAGRTAEPAPALMNSE